MPSDLFVFYIDFFLEMSCEIGCNRDYKTYIIDDMIDKRERLSATDSQATVHISHSYSVTGCGFTYHMKCVNINEYLKFMSFQTD